LSVRLVEIGKPEALRHLGCEDASATELSKETDVNGIGWDRFNVQQQSNEIAELWPEANFTIE